MSPLVVNRTFSIRSLILLLLFFSIAPAEDTETYEDAVYPNIEESVAMVVTTTASKKQEEIGDAPGVITVITQDELKRFGGTTLADILKRVPSFLEATIYMTDRSVIASRGDQIMPSSSHILMADLPHRHGIEM